MGIESGKVIVVLGTKNESMGDLEHLGDGLVQLDLGSLDEMLGGEHIYHAGQGQGQAQE